MLKNDLSITFLVLSSICYIMFGGKLNKDLNDIYEQLFIKTETNHHLSVFVSGAERIGASWCALSVAHALNLRKKKVLLVDGNGGFSNICSYIYLNNPLYLEEYIEGNKTLNQLVTAYKNKNFNILTAQSGNNYISEQPIGRVHVFSSDLKVLVKDYDHTIIDIGKDLSKNNFVFCQMADNINIVCSDKSSDLIKTFELIQFIYKRGLSAACNLIINRVNSFEDGYKIYKELCKAVERSGIEEPKLLGIVRFDARIRDTVKNKELLLIRYPASEAAIDIHHIAQKLDLENKDEENKL